MSLIITLTASMLTCPLIAPDQTILPQLQVDDAVFSNDVVIVGTSERLTPRNFGITETVGSTPVSIAEWTDGLVTGGSDNDQSSVETAHAIVDSELDRATRAVRTR